MTNPILESLPPYSPYNNGREIIRKKLESFQSRPSIQKAQELEEYGFSVDMDWVTESEGMDGIGLTNNK